MGRIIKLTDLPNKHDRDPYWEKQSVIDRMVKPGNCVFEGFEPWEDETVILTFRLLDYDDIKPVNN